MTPNPCYRFVLLFCRVVVCPCRYVFVRGLGGSFAKLGFSVGLCGFANVPPNAMNYLKTKISTVPIKAIAPVAIAIILINLSCFGKSIASMVFVKFSVAAIKS